MPATSTLMPVDSDSRRSTRGSDRPGALAEAGPAGKDATRAGLIAHYDDLAPRYSRLYERRSRLAHFYRMRQVRALELVDIVHGGRILEVGCGPAYLANEFVGRHMAYCGVDLSRGMLRVAREQCHAAHFAVGDTRELGLADRSFDAVVCLGMLEYVANEDVVIDEMARVLKPGGTCVISGINRWSPYNAWDRLVHRRLKQWQPAGIVHEYHDDNEYRGWLKRSGLSVVDVVYFDFDLFLPPLDKYARSVAVGSSERLESCGRSRWRRLGNGFLVKATKVA